MTQDEILEALHKVVQENKHYTTWTVSTPHLVALVNLAIEQERERLTDAAMKAAEKGIDTAIALEREACAKVCDVLAYHPEFASDATKLAAMAIRARGQA